MQNREHRPVSGERQRALRQLVEVQVGIVKLAGTQQVLGVRRHRYRADGESGATEDEYDAQA